MKTNHCPSTIAFTPRANVTDCGGERSVTPLSDDGVPGEELRRRFALPEQSTTWRSLVFALVLAATAMTVQVQYSIDWSTVDGGGGTSTGGVYSVTGTIGQPDTGAMSGGNYTLEGGFWGIIAAVQTPGAPLLSILRTTTNTVAVFWPSPSTGWDLQQNTNSVSSMNWSNVTATVQDDGTTKTLIVNPPAGNKFYRLHKP